MNNVLAAYIAGFLDADGSIYVQLKKNTSYKYDFQIYAQIVFYQSSKHKQFLLKLCEDVGHEYVRERNDDICEYVIGDYKGMIYIIDIVQKYLKLKNQQLILLQDILNQKQNIYSAEDFLKLAVMIDKFRELNYQKKRINTADMVEKHFIERGFIDPVET